MSTTEVRRPTDCPECRSRLKSGATRCASCAYELSGEEASAARKAETKMRYALAVVAVLVAAAFFWEMIGEAGRAGLLAAFKGAVENGQAAAN